ncbi:MAG: 50S ribosomal protein L30, partial [Thermoplasmata archaeon]|nr:50S ribosomal protein L30 [Thermoplasmata archaeon]
HDIVETLKFLHLNRPQHVTVVPEKPEFRGMLTKIQGYVTWGEAEPETVGLLLKSRGETAGGERLTDANVTESTRTKDLAELTQRVVVDGLPSVAGVRPLFRLGAPSGGWKSTKKPYALGGALGYRGRAINELARRMIRE